MHVLNKLHRLRLAFVQALAYEAGTHLMSSGALAMLSGVKTGRTPKDKRIVRELTTEADIWYDQHWHSAALSGCAIPAQLQASAPQAHMPSQGTACMDDMHCSSRCVQLLWQHAAILLDGSRWNEHHNGSPNYTMDEHTFLLRASNRLPQFARPALHF